MTTGTVKKVVPERGFGFITADDGKDYFFHRSVVTPRWSLMGWPVARRSSSTSSRTRRARGRGTSNRRER